MLLGIETPAFHIRNPRLSLIVWFGDISVFHMVPHCTRIKKFLDSWSSWRRWYMVVNYWSCRKKKRQNNELEGIKLSKLSRMKRREVAEYK